MVEETEESRERERVTPAEATVEVACAHDELTTPLRGDGPRDTLEVLQDLRDRHGICAEELDVYRREDRDSDEATQEALVRRSLEDFFHKRVA